MENPCGLISAQCEMISSNIAPPVNARMRAITNSVFTRIYHPRKFF
ncbi:MAG: hypothetical protein K6F76_07550 [Clostridiales bacterium]|nr:hypothetical protein [Clostridiales bacterium]